MYAFNHQLHASVKEVNDLVNVHDVIDLDDEIGDNLHSLLAEVVSIWIL